MPKQNRDPTQGGEPTSYQLRREGGRRTRHGTEARTARGNRARGGGAGGPGEGEGAARPPPPRGQPPAAPTPAAKARRKPGGKGDNGGRGFRGAPQSVGATHRPAPQYSGMLASPATPRKKNKGLANMPECCIFGGQGGG